MGVDEVVMESMADASDGHRVETGESEPALVP